MTSNISRLAYSLLTIAALGCGGGLPLQSTSDDTAPVHRTVVHLNADGSSTASVETITRAEQQAEIEARRAAHERRQDSGIATRQDAISVDGGCAYSSMWMFDQINYHGSEICFYGEGIATLANYERAYFDGIELVLGGNWQAATRSYYAGNEQGAFHGPPSDPWFAYCSEAFGPWGHLQVAAQCAQVSYELMLLDW